MNHTSFSRAKNGENIINQGGTFMLKRTKILSIILCSIIMATFFTACIQQARENRTATKANQVNTVKNPNLPDLFEITKSQVFGDEAEYPELKAEFQELLEKELGCPVKINYPPHTDYMTKINLMLTSGELKGLVKFFDTPDILKAIEDGTIEPLDDYLKDNANWNSMPEEYKKCYKFNGKTYAIPGGFTGNLFTRSIRKDWLDKLGLKTPETVDDFLAVVRAFTENDPDGNGKADTFGLVTNKMWNLQDIFQAFDARLSNTGDFSICWNPNTGVWEDSMLKPEMVDALNYVKYLYQHSYMDPEWLTNKGSATLRQKLWSGKYGSVFYWALHGYQYAMDNMKETVPEAYFVEVPALKGKIVKNLNHITLSGCIYVLIKGTAQPREVVNTFVDNFLFNEKVHFMVRAGIEGKTFKMDGQTGLWIIDPATKAPFKNPGFVDYMPRYNDIDYPFVTEGTAEEIQKSISFIRLNGKMKEKGKATGTVYELPGPLYYTPLSSVFATRKQDVDTLYQQCYSRAITGEIPIEQAIKEYREKMKALGADQILEDANKAIGKTATMKY